MSNKGNFKSLHLLRDKLPVMRPRQFGIYKEPDKTSLTHSDVLNEAVKLSKREVVKDGARNAVLDLIHNVSESDAQGYALISDFVSTITDMNGNVNVPRHDVVPLWHKYLANLADSYSKPYTPRSEIKARQVIKPIAAQFGQYMGKDGKIYRVHG